MSEPSESCSTCRYALEATGTLFCRRQPPQLVVLTSHGFVGMPTDRVAARFPEVTALDWCGEFKQWAQP